MGAPAPDRRDDAALARAIAGGSDPAAESALVGRYHRRVVLYGMRHLRDEQQAADLAQDVLSLVLERLRQGAVRDAERIGSYVLGTARLMVRDSRRRDRRRVEIAAQLAHETDSIAAPAPALDVDRLAEGLESLPERDRAIVVLTFYDGLEAGEIGKIFGLTAGNVRIIRHRAVSRLRGLLDPGGEP